MDVVGFLPRLWLSYEFCVLVQDPGEFSRGARGFSGFIGGTLQSFLLAHYFSFGSSAF
jgi:hypothetical protein